MSAKLLNVGAFVFLSLSTATHAQQLAPPAAALSALRLPVTPVANYTLVFEHPESVLSERRPIGTVVSLIRDFLAERTDVPAPTRSPRVEFVSSAQIAAVRYRDISSDPELFWFNSTANALDMVYDDAQGIIYLSQLWTGASPAELSVLVHGLVNHAQREAGLTYACTQEREQVAFAAQEAWLKLFGQNVKDTLGLDEAAYMLSTQCVP